MFPVPPGCRRRSVRPTSSGPEGVPRACRTGRSRRYRATRLDAFKPSAGGRAAPTPGNYGRRLREQGYPRGYAGVRDYVSKNLRGKPQPIGPRPPSARAVTCWILTHPDALPEGDRIQLKAVLANCPELTTLVDHVRSFAHMVTELQGDRLPEWIVSARTTTDLPSLSRFAHHLERDLDAVIAGLTLPWSSGVVEGHVNRIKMLKRQMYGRAGFKLLRKRILLAS
ncbi:transposase [Streptomyces sp. NPDC058308]|uniref:transposase n=1 Tax=Streptomyces sp. NPDC058308 TaxID=3346440 RepID=UPI0036ECE890